ncbi:hypothetical protein POM88_032972 [Heracleum sosnowskyi]|uniref:Uncharacterized protein n=1 Tax=Heracleum sosnowskyi TaxID=360622 RepID=A0AAD8I0E9_9APIA|nr:hypothetical protein POM88_032972 [Heracleum sosnowskyi]
MMWSSSLASFKENLNKIAQDVHDDDDEYDDSSIYNSNDRNDSPVSNRRFSDRSFSYSNSNGFDSAHDSELIQKLTHAQALFWFGVKLNQMMWSSSLASFKENLNKIAQDVHDDDDEYDNSSIYNLNDCNDSPVSNRRFSDRFSDRSFSYSNSNGFDSAHDSEFHAGHLVFYMYGLMFGAVSSLLCYLNLHLKGVISEYAALLKEKEDCISRINEENSLLKQNLGGDKMNVFFYQAGDQH